jgi:molybdopterin molybdotransferase
LDPRGRGFKRLTSIQNVLHSLKPLLNNILIDHEKISLTDAYGRFLAEDIVSSVDVPGFDRAAMDGYAVKAEDTFHVSPSNPIELKITDSIDFTKSRKLQLESGEAIEVVTGSPIPDGSNAVIMVEYTSRRKDILEIFSSVYPGENITRKDEDVKQGETVLNKGNKLTPYDLSLLKTIGFKEVKVYCKPRIAVASTGNELVEDFNNMKNFKIIDTNRILLFNLIKESGANFIDLGLIKDNLPILQKQIIHGANIADITVLSGGSSVGKFDLLPEALKKAGGKIVVHGVAMRPGMPTAVGIIQDRPVFILPGNPVAAALAFRAIVRPSINMLLKSKRVYPSQIEAKLLRRVASPPGIRSFIRVMIKTQPDGTIIAEPVRISGSSIITSMIRSNGILEVPESLEGFDEGSIVKIELFKPLEESQSEGSI